MGEFELQARLDDLDSAISALNDAIDALKLLGSDSETDVEVLGDIRRNLEREYNSIDNALTKLEQAEAEALEREYYAGVI